MTIKQLTVKQLIDKLQKCDPDALVYAETWYEPRVQAIGTVSNYNGDNKDVVYITDDLFVAKKDLKNGNFILKEVK